MTKNEIIEALRENHNAFVAKLQTLSEQAFLASPANKWTAGQHLEHIVLSTAPLALGLRMPKFLLRLVFGKANRPSKSYEDLVLKYQITLKNGGKATGRFIPKAVAWAQKEKLIQRLQKNVEALVQSLAKYTETDLDMLVAPHPLLGKLTLREMLYFTAYHVTHHQKNF
jgi:hypothetical protein